ncbi:sensor domain-containing diguanylate cyclase [Alkalicoccus urumqiensis]|nr:sensor domain-containing diguanylate cyclase [Alkalicoccus urumqiensis]
MSRWIYPWIFYLPLLPVLFTFITGTNVLNSSMFEQEGAWIYPVFNTAYLTTLSAAVFTTIIMTVLVGIQWKRSRRPMEQRVYFILFVFVLFSAAWNTVFGYLDIRGAVPPYPYIFAGIFGAWAMFFAVTRFDFLEAGSRKFKTLYERNPTAILLLNNYGIIQDANPAAHYLLEEKKLKGFDFTTWLTPESRTEWEETFAPAMHGETPLTALESEVITAGSVPRKVLIDSDFITVDYEPVLMMILRDVTETKKAEETIRYLAYHDTLTQLPNRRAFSETVRKHLKEKQKVAVINVDLDGFKKINDTYGHQTGDEYLAHLASILEKETTGLGGAARVGGDEFNLYYFYTSTEEVKRFISQLQKTLIDQPLKTRGLELPIRTSIGASLAPQDGTELEELLSRADEAMYSVKHNGKGAFALYNEGNIQNLQHHR